jgi:hypothetical protein
MTQLAPPDSSAPLGEINAFWRSDGSYRPSRISELSQTSAFIKTTQPEPVETLLQLRMDVPGREIYAHAVVRRVVPGEGMGVEFESMADDDRARLYLFVNSAPRSSSPASSAGSSANSATTSAPATRDPALRRGHRPVEQRGRVRYKFIATVELTESAPGRTFPPVQARVTDLAKGGCYVKAAVMLPLGTELAISITGNGQTFRARAKVVSAQPGDSDQGMGLAFADIDPQQLFVLDGWLATSTERTWLAANRRRSHRIMVNLPVQVAVKNERGNDISEDTTTISISAHGALLQLQMEVAKGQTLLLRNAVTNNALECSVDYLGSTRNGRREVGVSFVVPNQTLWQISFPPEDWSPQHPDAKRS